VRKYKGHTPGQWRRSSLAPLYIIAGNEPNPICSLGEYDEDLRIDSVFDNAEANARLIADAPKLLEQRDHLLAALDEVMELIEGYVDIRDGDSGPAPNDAMRAKLIIEDAKRRIG